MFTNIAVTAMSSAAGIPSSYITVTGVDNSCVNKLQPPRRRRSLFQSLISGSAYSTSTQQPQQQSAPNNSSSSSSSSGNNPPAGAANGDGVAVVKAAVTWPADVVTYLGLTASKAELILSNCTTLRVLSTLFTPAFMEAYGINSVPYATVISESNLTPLNTTGATTGSTRGSM